MVLYKWKSAMTLHNKWEEVSAELDILGTTVDFRSPSSVQLGGALRHFRTENLVLLRCLSGIKPIRYVVDVGANIGGTALLFRSAFPDARILAIEPVSNTYDYLLHNTKDIPQIETLKMASYNKRDRISLAMPLPRQRPAISLDFGNDGLYSIYGKDTEHSEMVDADTLDSMAGGPVDLLKIDVEGAEMCVLEGAKRIVAEDRPIIIIELREENIDMSGHTLREYEDYFVATNYKMSGYYKGDPLFFPSELV